METVADFIFLSFKITVDGDCSHKIKRHLLLRRKAVTNQDSVLKNRDITLGFSRWCSDNKPAYQCRRHRRHGFNPWLRRSPGEGNGNPLQYSCLGNPMDRGAWWTTVHGIAKSQTQMSTHTCSKNCLEYTYTKK